MPFPIGGPLEQSLNPAVFETLRSKRIKDTSLTFQGHVTSWVTWPFDTHMPFPIGGPLEPSLYSNGFRYIHRRMSRNGWHDLDTTFKRRSRSFILVPIDFSCTTSYRLSIVTFALGRTIYPQYIPYRRQTRDGRNTVPIVRPLVRSAKNWLSHVELTNIYRMDHATSQCVIQHQCMLAGSNIFWRCICSPRAVNTLNKQ